jgi:hypothetical protein
MSSVLASKALLPGRIVVVNNSVIPFDSDTHIATCSHSSFTATLLESLLNKEMGTRAVQ